MNEEERERERIEAGWELERMHRKAPKTWERDIVDMVYDDGLTNKEALELEKAYRAELAHDFRRAIEALPPVRDEEYER